MQQVSIPFEQCQTSSLMGCSMCHTWTHLYNRIIAVYACWGFQETLARDRYLKCCHKFNEETSASPIHGNWRIKCLKHKASLWLLNPTHPKSSNLCSKLRYKNSISSWIYVSCVHAIKPHVLQWNIRCLMKNGYSHIKFKGFHNI